MSKEDTQNLFGYTLLRDYVLPSILGKHEEEILYWAGKEIAREFPIFSLEEIPTFFTTAQFGELVLIREGKNERLYQLTPPNDDFLRTDRSYSLEAGVIAEYTQKLHHFLTEGHATPEKKNNRVELLIKWDEKTIVEQQ